MNRLPVWISRPETISPASGWRNMNRERHLLVSMHPSEIPMAPSQIILVSEGKIWTVPPATSWSEIRVLLQKPHLTSV